MVSTGDGYHVFLSPDPTGPTRGSETYTTCGVSQCAMVCQTIDPPTTALPPTPPITLKMALDVLQRDEQHAVVINKIILAILSFSIFVSAMFLHIPTTSLFQQHYGVFSTLATSGSDAVTDQSPVKFTNIVTIPDIFDWLKDTFTPQVFVTTDYNGAALPTDQWGRIATFSKVLGAVHFEVTYMEAGDCDTPLSLLDIYTTCFDESQTTTEEFFIGFETNVSVATALLTDKKDSGSWLNSSTSQLLITVITLNGQLSGYAVTKLQFDFKDGGYIKPSASTTATLLDQYPSSTPIILDVLTVLWFSWILFSTIISNSDRRKWTWTFPDKWSVVDYCRGPIVYLFYITVLVTQTIMMNSDFRRNLTRIGEGGPIDGEDTDTLKSVTRSFGLIASLTVSLRLLATTAVLVLGLGILNASRDYIGLSTLTRTLLGAFRTFVPLSVIFAIVFVAFAAAGTVLFGDRVQEFSTFLKAMKTCMNMICGDFDFDIIQDIDYSVVYYWAYMTMGTFVLLNIMLAIVNAAYQEQKKETYENCWKFSRLADNLLRQWLASVRDLLCSPKVVFWGRIRPEEVQTMISDTLSCEETSSAQLEWSADALKDWFPDATMEECEATEAYLAKEHEHQFLHESLEKDAGLDKTHTSTAIPDTVQKAKGSARDDTAPPAQKHSSFSENERTRLDLEKVIARIDTVQHTMAVLAEQMMNLHDSTRLDINQVIGRMNTLQQTLNAQSSR